MSSLPFYHTHFDAFLFCIPIIYLYKAHLILTVTAFVYIADKTMQQTVAEQMVLLLHVSEYSVNTLAFWHLFYLKYQNKHPNYFRRLVNKITRPRKRSYVLRHLRTYVLPITLRPVPVDSQLGFITGTTPSKFFSFRSLKNLLKLRPNQTTDFLFFYQVTYLFIEWDRMWTNTVPPWKWFTTTGWFYHVQPHHLSPKIV